MEVSGLVVLHSTVKGSNKVWGWFVDEDQRYHKYWGKRTADKFQIQGSTIQEVSRDKMNKVKKGYTILSAGTIFNDTQKTLETQLGVSVTTVTKSVVTGKTMPTPIKPSEVCRTFEANDIITFYDKNMDILGTRSADMRETIFNHIRKTKDSVQSGNTPETIWTDK
jgi:hypothetical protein